MVTWLQLRLQAKPVGCVNVAGYFDSLLQFPATMRPTKDSSAREHRGLLTRRAVPGAIAARLTRDAGAQAPVALRADSDTCARLRWISCRRRSPPGATPRRPPPRPRWTDSGCDCRLASAAARPDARSKPVAHASEQAGGLGAEDEPVAGANATSPSKRRRASSTRTCVARAGLPLASSASKLACTLIARELVIVEAGAPQLLVVEVEAERCDQVQSRAGIRRKANHVAGIGRNLRRDQHDVETS